MLPPGLGFNAISEKAPRRRQNQPDAAFLF